MIGKPPRNDDVSLSVWMREVALNFNNYIQTIDIPVSKSGIIGNYAKGKHPAKNMVALDKAYFGFIVPRKLAEFKECTIRFIPNTTGSINYTVNLSYGGVGDSHNLNSKTVSVTGEVVTDAEITEIDITDLFTDQDPDDQIGCEFVLDALTTTTSIDILNLYIKYI